jgi:hypothetical protein
MDACGSHTPERNNEVYKTLGTRAKKGPQAVALNVAQVPVIAGSEGINA